MVSAASRRSSLSPKLEKFDWVNAPGQFVEQLSAHLWTTHQLDGFRKAAIDYARPFGRDCAGRAAGYAAARNCSCRTGSGCA